MTSRTFIAGLAVACCAACAGHDAQRPAAVDLPAATVRVQVAEPKSRIVAEEVAGTIRAKRQARLEAKVAGRIEQMRAVPGEAVRTGQLLVRLDFEETRAKLDQAVALRQQAVSDLERYEALLDRGAATPSEFEAVQARSRVAQATVEEVQTMLGHAEILAPFNGVVTRKLADVGDLAVPGRPLVEMEDPAALRAEADVGESLIDRLEIGQLIEVRVSTMATPLQGTVTEIGPAADPASRTFVVKVDLPRTPGLRGGAFASIAVPVGRTDALRVPATAVVQRGQLELVFVANEGQAELRLVKTGKRDGAEVELLAGVSAGESVVVSGAAQLREGQPLQIEP
jgi:RND family efflux transporter MFP subunit